MTTVKPVLLIAVTETQESTHVDIACFPMTCAQKVALLEKVILAFEKAASEDGLTLWETL